MSDRTLRLSQTLVPFGVGAIYDYRGESLVACDISYWKGAGDQIELRRLEEQLGVEMLRAAPSRASLFGGRAGPGVPFLRFPQWLFCPRCRRMTRWRMRFEREGRAPVCERCPRHPQLVPMRFVMACRASHLGDVPWEFWAHFGAESPAQRQCRSLNLRFEASGGQGAGLDALRVVCSDCDASRPLRGITSQDTVRHMHLRCPGRQPWQRVEEAECGEVPVVLQRGASNLYFADTESAIDIPPDSSYEVYSDLSRQVTADPMFIVIRSAPDGPASGPLIQQLAQKYEVTPQRIRQIVDQGLADVKGELRSGEVADDETKLRREEWTAFLTERPDSDDRDRFITKNVAFEPDEAPASIQRLTAKIANVVLATKLREVRALAGFRRYDPGAPRVSPDLGRGLDWRPAIEVYGEGTFIALDEGAVSAWESKPEVVDRVRRLEERRRTALIGERLPIASPRLVLVHTLAHTLIRQLAFESGYAAASLRERLYCSSPEEKEGRAGLLIYTAAGDVEGTLGGLVRQGEPPRLARTFLAMLETAAWCSSDPICVESAGQGFQALNLAACHACGLISETSCEHSNALLDRGLLIDPEIGFLHEVVEMALAESVPAMGAV